MQPADIWDIMEKEGLSFAVISVPARDPVNSCPDVYFEPTGNDPVRKLDLLKEYAQAVLPLLPDMLEKYGREPASGLMVELYFVPGERRAVFSVMAPRTESVEIERGLDSDRELDDQTVLSLSGLTVGDLLNALESRGIASMESEFSVGDGQAPDTTLYFVSDSGTEVQADSFVESMASTLVNMCLADEFGDFSGNFFATGTFTLVVGARGFLIYGNHEDRENMLEVYDSDVTRLFTGKVETR